LGITWQEVWAGTYQLPWPLTHHLVQLGVIAGGVFFLAYVFWHQGEAERPTQDRADIGAAEAFKTIVVRSKRSKELVAKGLLTTPTPHESELTSAGVIERRVKKRLEGELLDALRQGRVRAWGEPRDSKAEREIEKEEWARMELDLNERNLYSIPPSICAISNPHPRGEKIEYLHIQFCRANLFREFPLTSWPRHIDYVPLEKSRTSSA
jgi:hypothetical protein